MSQEIPSKVWWGGHFFGDTLYYLCYTNTNAEHLLTELLRNVEEVSILACKQVV